MPYITIEPYGIKVEAKKGATLYQVLRKTHIDITSICGGFGLCGKCRVIIVKGHKSLSKVIENEKRFLTDEDFLNGYRLACQAKIIGDEDIVVLVPPESRAKVGERKAVVEGYMRPVTLRPAIKKIKAVLAPSTLHDQRADFERLLDYLRNEYGLEDLDIDIEALRMLPHVIRESEQFSTVVLWNEREIIAIEPGDTTDHNYGVSIDIGTSKIVAHLVNLNNGKVIATAFVENPQLSHGEDIISRITFASSSRDNALSLHKLLIDSVNELVTGLCRYANVNPKNVYEIVVVGNTAMHHFFLNLETLFVAKAPYVPVISKSISVKARELGLRINRSAIVTVLPVIGGFVGADAVANALAVDIINSRDPAVLIDIGTNTEIFVGNSNLLVTGSAPSGPAFEGARITFGMKAVNGAIESVKIRENGEVEYDVIGDIKPRGIAGSAMIDIVAELYRNKFIDARGNFKRDLNLKRLRRNRFGYEFVIAWANETAIGRDIVVSEKDIKEIILAKAAIFAGFSVLMKRRELKYTDISTLFIAGSFGSHINLHNAISIGLLPPLPLNKIKFVGNTAIAGADLALISTELREEAEKIAKIVKYIELSADPLFKEEFINALWIPHRKLQFDIR